MKKSLLFLSLFSITMTSAFSLPDLLSRDLFKVNQIDKIEFDLSWENIDIQECDEAENILVEIYCNKEKYAPKIKTSGSTLIVKSVKTPSFGLISKKCTVILRVPNNVKFDKALFETTSGNIHSQMVLNANSLKFSSTSGYQSITVEVFADNAVFESTSGSIFAETVVGKKLKMSATSGKISINAFDGESCSLEATSGSIKMLKTKTQQAKISTTSGNISCEGGITDAFDVSSSSGTIGLELDDAPESKSRVSSTSGTIFVGVPGNANFSVRAETTSGAFVNTLTNEKVGSSANYRRDINNGGALLILSSTSGRITLDSTDGITARGNDTTTDSFDSIDEDIPVVTFDDPIF